jgi:hypothetical protein
MGPDSIARYGTGPIAVAFRGVVHHNDRWSFVSVDIEQIESGAIDSDRIPDRIDSGLSGRIGPWRDPIRIGLCLSMRVEREPRRKREQKSS